MPPPPNVRQIDGILLDMDGTILNSIKTAERIWGAWAQQHGLDLVSFLPTIHGVQSVETIRRLGLTGIDPVVEAAAITQAELDDIVGIEAIAGAAEFLAALSGFRWGIVTSAPRALALRRMEAAGFPVPPLLIAAEDVTHGKPAPDCFLLAAERLGTTADRCLVFEDSSAGIAAADAAGAAALVVTSTHLDAVTHGHDAILDYRDLVLERLSTGALWLRQALDDSAHAPDVSFVLNAVEAVGPTRS